MWLTGNFDVLASVVYTALSFHRTIPILVLIYVELSKSFDDEPVFGAPLSMSVIDRVLPLISFLETEESKL